VIASPDTLRVDSTQLSAKHIIIASGSAPVELPGLKFDGRKIISSDSLLEIKKIPSSLLIVGAGAVGCEFASLFSSLGSRVAIAEKMPQLLPGLDKELAGRLESVYKKRKIKLSLNTDAAGLNLDEYESVLVCVGRIPRTADLGLEELGIKRDKRRIITDDFLRTASGNIYAAGDCSAELLLAHFAAYQGYLAAENIASDSPQKVSAAYVPNCIFTDPEIASVGPSEDELRQMGREIKVHRFDFLASGMARILEETEGFLKIISDKKTSVVLGASIIGPKATELIGALTIAAANRLSIPQLKETIFAHPTLSECLGEALGH
jgi:dihydrolipoamide dehydrogenase